MSDRITCSFCGRPFTEEEGRTQCANCAVLGSGGCRKVRCPHCGYESPLPPRLPGLIARLWRRLINR
jgi:DNA-directed RNA polymerase subunit RPC12/RpoP